MTDPSTEAPSRLEFDQALQQLTDGWTLSQLIYDSPLLFIETEDQIFTKANQTVRDMIGDLLVGRSVSWWMDHIIHPDDRQPTIDWFSEALANGTGPEVKYIMTNRVLRRDGEHEQVWWYSYVNSEKQKGNAIGMRMPHLIGPCLTCPHLTPLGT